MKMNNGQIKIGEIHYTNIDNNLCAFVYLKKIDTDEIYPIILNIKYLQDGYEAFKIIRKIEDDRFPSLDLSDSESKS